MDGHAGRGSRRRPRCPVAASEPRRHRRRGSGRDVHQSLRPRPRRTAESDSAAADSASPVSRRARPGGRHWISGCRCRRLALGAVGRCRCGQPGCTAPSVGCRRCPGLRPLVCPDLDAGRRTFTTAAQPQPLVAHRSDRYRPHGLASRGQSGRRLDQRRLPGRPVRRVAALPRGAGCARSLRCRRPFR